MKRESPESEPPDAPRNPWKIALRILHRIVMLTAWFVAILLTIWAIAALYFDFPCSNLKIASAIVYAIALIAACVLVRQNNLRLTICFAGFALILIWWLTLRPSNLGPWQPDESETAWAEINGDTVIIHNYRDCRYRTEYEYTCQWLTKTVKLSDLRGIDISLIHWGLPKIAHLIVSFHFVDASQKDDYVAVSVEMRKRSDQTYSAIRGFFRQFTLIYIFADERDLIRLRSNFRQGEEVDLYRTTADAAYARQLFLRYLLRANQLHEKAEWYNAVTRNCTTDVFAQMRAIGPLPAGISRLDPRVLLSGEADEMLYDRGLLAANNLPFSQLRDQSRINPTARAAGNSPDFSQVIRAGRAGFDQPTQQK
jgi:Domain of unknown function (DUF4105)